MAGTENSCTLAPVESIASSVSHGVSDDELGDFAGVDVLDFAGVDSR